MGVHVLDANFYGKEKNRDGNRFVRCPKMDLRNGITIIYNGYCNYCGVRLDRCDMTPPTWINALDASVAEWIDKAVWFLIGIASGGMTAYMIWWKVYG
jgi:hypothetical protein